MKRIILTILLIGFSFVNFHDFVFLKIDPCMKNFQEFTTIDKNHFNDTQNKDPLCDIHSEIHHILHFIIQDTFYSYIETKSTYNFEYKKPFIKLISSSIFKPPKLI